MAKIVIFEENKMAAAAICKSFHLLVWTRNTLKLLTKFTHFGCHTRDVISNTVGLIKMLHTNAIHFHINLLHSCMPTKVI